MKFTRYTVRASVKIRSVDTRDAKNAGDAPTTLRPGEYPNRETPQEPGLGRWIKRNPWLLTRLFMVLVFSFGATATAANFSYGLEINPIPLSAEQINEGRLPPEASLEDYVEITGTPDYGQDTSRIGVEESKIGWVTRYSANYFYFGFEETGDNLIVQTAETPPDVTDESERVWSGKLSTVGSVIFHDSTTEGLENAGLTTNNDVPIIETGDTPNYYRQIFPAYATILGVWILSMVWLVWKRNKPFLDE